LKTLGADRVYGLMLHHGSDLLGRGGESIWTGLEQAKRAGKVERIGVSVYTPEEAAAINDRFPIEIIQVPFSAFDQRMRTSGMFDRLKRSDVEIHVRSVFLQGFALGDPGRLPMHLVPWRAVLERFRRHAVEHGVTPLRLALAVAEQEPAVDRIVVGAQSSRELKEILDSSVAPVDALDASALACADLNLINPSNWSATA
jgi:aryl-alcohol dehydrogenase-like predicted oxidoreductase